MFNRYNRPEQLLKDFIVETKAESKTSRGRVIGDYAKDGSRTFKAILCGATPEQRAQFKQINHTITHVISHRGNPKAKESDRLICDGKIYLINSIDNPGEMGLWTLYYCEERKDQQDGQ
ncbi:MAG: head-tail adaptor protein [Ruminococcus sp.]